MISSITYPPLPAGIGFDCINGDCWNGSGVNVPIDDIAFNSYAPQQPMIVTPAMLGIFSDTCPDIPVKHLPNTVTLPQEIRTLVMRGS